MPDLFAITTAHKQRLADKHHDIKAKLSIGRNNRSEFFALVGLLTRRTNELRDMGMKLTDGQRGERTGIGFTYGQSLAAGTKGTDRFEVQRRPLDK